MNVSDFVSLLLELFSWIGLSLGLLCCVVALLVRATGGRWLETTAVVLHESGSVVARWMAEDGRIFSRNLDHHEHEQLAEEDAATVFFCQRRPQLMRLHRRGAAERTLMLVAVILGGVGALSWLAGLALGFVPE